MTEQELDRLIKNLKEKAAECEHEKEKFVHDKDTTDELNFELMSINYIHNLLEKQQARQATFCSNGYIVWYECQACGKQVTIYDKYCKGCGQKLLEQ